MIKPEQIPKVVIEEFLRCHNDEGIEYTWSECIAAAINAWPNVEVECNLLEEWVVLPLPQEKNND